MFWMTSQAFVLMSGVVLGPVATGTLKAAASITGLINILLQALDNFAPMQASQALQAGGREALLRYLTRLGGLIAALLALFVVLLSSDTDAIVRMIYGHGYPNLGYLVHWLCAAAILYSLSVLLSIWAAAIERTQLIFASYAAATVFTVIAGYPLTSMLGMQGVLLGAVIVEAIKVLALLIPLARWGRPMRTHALPAG
jgi:O-antigen/teichoic acid export membrane protein